MPVEEIHIGESDTKDGELKVTVRGPVDAVMKILIHGLSHNAIVEMNAAVQRELAKRKPGRDDEEQQ